MNNASTILTPNTGWIILAIFSVGWVLLGYWWGRKAKDLEGFMLAGRNVGLALGTATAMATWVTSNTIMLAPQFALRMGIWGMLAYSTASFGLFLFAPMAFRIKQLIPNGYTSGDFMRLRYGNAVWVLFLLVSVAYSLVFLISMAMAGGIVLEALAGIDYEKGMLIVLTVCVLYTLYGGLYAVIGTDFIQSLIILAGIVAVGTAVLLKTDQGAVYQYVSTNQPMLFDMLMPVALLSFFNNMLFGFGEIFHSNIWWSRAFAMREKVAHKAYFLAGLLWFPIPVAAGFIVLAAGPLGINITDIDAAGPIVASEILGVTGAILVFIVIFCSLASSIDSLLAATSDLITEDIYYKMINPEATEAQRKRVTMGAILGLGIVAGIISYPRFDDLPSVLFGWAGPLVASAIFPILCGLYWKRACAHGAFIAIVAGATTGLTLNSYGFWYIAALSSALASFAVMMFTTALSQRIFSWETLNESENK